VIRSHGVDEGTIQRVLNYTCQYNGCRIKKITVPPALNGEGVEPT